jgi:DNA-binding LacI/PurR family transcriptional regulator
MSAKPKRARGERNSFKAIASTLQARVENGDIPLGRYLPTEREIQEEFGVSRSTVRRALGLLVEDGWIQNIPNRGVVAGSGVRRAKTNNIALIDDQTYVLRVLHLRISEWLRSNGYHLIHLGGRVHHLVEDAFRYAEEQDFAGALVWPFRGFPDIEAIREAARRLPSVVMDHRINGVSTDLVTFDYFDAAYQAASQLAKNGRKRIAVSGMLDMLEINHQRFSGYMKALFDHDLQPHSTDFQFVTTSGMREHDASMLADRLRDTNRPDAIFIMQDEMVPTVVETILSCGLSIPDDVAIATVGDDMDLTVDGMGLTAVALDWDELAMLAVQLLLERIEDPERAPVSRYAPHRLIVRGSCGASKSAWTDTLLQPTGFHGEVPIPRSRFRFQTGTLANNVAAVYNSHSGGLS